MISSLWRTSFEETRFLFFIGRWPTLRQSITTTVKLVDAGHPPFSDGSYYVGPYDLLINGQTVAALCIDFADHQPGD
jgi:hypothetical protein